MKVHKDAQTFLGRFHNVERKMIFPQLCLSCLGSFPLGGYANLVSSYTERRHSHASPSPTWSLGTPAQQRAFQTFTVTPADLRLLQTIRRPQFTTYASGLVLVSDHHSEEHYQTLLDTAWKKTDTRIVISSPLPTYRRGSEWFSRLFVLQSWLRS
ncbi:hypothetical protein SRHO_G00193120 [Serrasalmus rhombeus]